MDASPRRIIELITGAGKVSQVRLYSTIGLLSGDDRFGYRRRRAAKRIRPTPRSTPRRPTTPRVEAVRHVLTYVASCIGYVLLPRVRL